MNLFDRKTAQVLATILAFAAGLWVLWGLRELFFLFLLAIFFAYTVEPLIAAIYRHTPRQVSRRTSIFATFLVVFLASSLTVAFIGQLVVDQASELIKQLPSLDQDPSTAVAFPLPAQLEPFRDELLNYSLDFARSTANAFVASLSSTGFLLLSPIFALFYLLEGPSYRHSLIQFAARTGHQVWLTGLLEDLRSLLSNYIRALFLQSLAVFLGYLAFYQVTRVPYTLLLATLAAVLEVIPVLGWISAAVLSLIVAAFSGYPHLVWMLVFYIVFRIFQDYVVTPYLMKNGIELPALVVLAGVIGGEMLGGIRGMFLSIPFLATLRILYRHWLKRGAILLLIGFSLDAHSISVSNSDARLEGQSIALHLRMPRYEAEHIPASGLAAAIQFKNASLAASSCAAVAQEILCDLTYQFQNPPAELVEANVTLARVTVPNHVHIMRFTRGPVTRQAVFDRTFENERIDLREVGKVELWWRAARMGFVQLAYQPILIALLLFIGRPIPYTAAAAAAFLVILPDRFYAVPGFFELATAISLSYLALEQIFFPDGAAKWAIFAFIGVLEGTALAILARPTGPGALAFGVGNLTAAIGVSLLANRLLRNFSPTTLRKIHWAFATLGVIWSIWVFVKRF